MISIIVIMSWSIPVFAADHQPSNVYTIQSGDTLWKIANKYGTTIEELKVTNGLQTDLLLIGQKLRVPIIYQVKAGDTLWEIAQVYHSSVQTIKAANSLTSDLILIGQKLKVPPKKMTVQGQYVLMTREEFKDWLFNHRFTRKVGKIQQHHTWSPSYKDFDGTNYFALLKSMQDYHINGMGWSNISQHLTTFPDGKVAVGRPFNIPPEGSFGLLNKTAMEEVEADALAIENVGNFDIGHDEMTAEQKETIVYISALLSIKFGLTPSVDSITYHHWWDINTGQRVLDNSQGHAIKTCPGTGFFGGNSTNRAKSNFYPQVSRKMKEILASMR